jgi:predicted NBD/HSP70 family sugar kinase
MAPNGTDPGTDTAQNPGSASPPLTAVDVYRAAATGDPLAVEIAEGVGARLAWAVHLLVMAYDVERVVLGGGVSHAGYVFVRPIERELHRLRESSALAREQLVPGIVDLLPPDANAGAWGAVTIAALADARIGSGHGWEEVGHVRET